MAGLQYPIVIADMPVRWDEPAWLPDPSPVFEETANANYDMIRKIESRSALLSQLVPAPPAGARGGPVAAGGPAAGAAAAAAAGSASSPAYSDESEDGSAASSDLPDHDMMGRGGGSSAAP